MKFKVGDKIKFNNGYHQGVGEIIFVKEIVVLYGVFSKDITNGNNLSGSDLANKIACEKGSDGNCLWFFEEDLELFIEKEEEKVTMVSGMENGEYYNYKLPTKEQAHELGYRQGYVCKDDERKVEGAIIIPKVDDEQLKEFVESVKEQPLKVVKDTETIEEIKGLHDKNKCHTEINFRGSQQEKIIEAIERKEMVNSPKHYNQTKFECIDEMIIIFGLKDVITWCKITAYKYKHRAGFKDDKQQDLNKSDWYLTKTKELKEKAKKGLYFKEPVKVLEPITIEELEEMGYELVGSGIKK